jgi:hypothetical protein
VGGENTYRAAIRDYEGKNYEAAEKKLLAILKQDPDHVGARSILNYVYTAMKQDPGRTMRGQFQRTVIPKVDFDQAPLDAVIEFLRTKTREISKGKITPNILIQSQELKTRPVTLRADNLPLSEVLFYVGQTAGLDFRYEKFSVVVSDRGNPGQLTFRSHDAVSRILVKRLKDKVAGTRIAKVDFDKAQLADVVAFLQRKVAEQTNGDFAPNIMLIAEARGPVTLSVDNMPLAALLRYVGDQAGISFSIEPYAIVGSSNRKPAQPLARERPESAPLPFQKEEGEDELIFKK